MQKQGYGSPDFLVDYSKLNTLDAWTDAYQMIIP